MAFEQELETYEAKLPELRAGHEGEFALIHGKDVLGVFQTYKEAIRAGKERIGFDTPFFVGWIRPADRQVVLLPSFVVATAPDETREEFGKKELEELEARLCREYGDLDTFMRKALRLDSASSPQT